MKYILHLSLIMLLVSPVFTGQSSTKPDIQKRIKEISQKLAGLKTEKKTVLNRIFELELRYEKTLIEKNRISRSLKKSRKKSKSLVLEKRALEKRISESKEKLRKILRILYKMRGNAVLRIFSGISSINQMFHNHKLFNCLIKDNTQTLDELRKNIESLNSVEKKLLEEQSVQQKKELELKGKLKELKLHRKSRLNTIRRINSDKERYKKYIEELRQEAGKMDKMMKNKIAGSFNIEKNFNSLKGRMIWPLKGKVISRFGRKKSTRFNTYIFSNGIRIKRRASSKIRSVLEGEVVWVDYKKGYGKIIVVQHSKDLHSIYGHCSEILKKKGDIVKKGETIAITGTSGSTYRESLYFEIRNKLRAVNPLKWLRKR